MIDTTRPFGLASDCRAKQKQTASASAVQASSKQSKKDVKATRALKTAPSKQDDLQSPPPRKAAELQVCNLLQCLFMSETIPTCFACNDLSAVYC